MNSLLGWLQYDHWTQNKDKYQNADRLSTKTEFYERQEQREADKPEIKYGFSFKHNEMYNSLALTGGSTSQVNQ